MHYTYTVCRFICDFGNSEMQLAVIKLLSESSTTAIIPCSTSLVHTTRTASDNTGNEANSYPLCLSPKLLAPRSSLDYMKENKN